MKILRAGLILTAVSAYALLTGCSTQPAKSADVSRSIRISLAQAGLKSVSVSQDREKGVVTLGGQVAADTEKAQAEAIAKPIAAGQVVANEILVVPPGVSGDARKINTDLDKGIGANVDAVLVQNKLNGSVKYAVHNGVVTLTGEVVSEAQRAQAQQVAAAVPYVQQVVNELQVKDQKASSTN